MQRERPKLNLQFMQWALRFFQHEINIVRMLQCNGQDSVPKWFLGTVVEDVTVVVVAEVVVTDQADLVIGTIAMTKTVARVPLMN